MKVKTAFTAMLLLSVSGSALAGMGGSKFHRFFDTNEDGVVAMGEFDGAAAERFARMDADKDGKLSQDEFRAYVKQRRGQRQQRKMAKMDTNKDGNISRDEFIGFKTMRAEKKFSRMDKDSNGVVTADEFKQCKSKHKGKKGKRFGGRMFNRLDANNDGTVTRDESYQAWSAWFNRIDANQDKTVTKDEVMQHRQNRPHHKNH